MSEKNRMIIAVDNTAIRSRVLMAAARAGYTPQILGSSYSLRELTSLDELTILETNDDVAELVQTVYEVYKSSSVTYTLPILALLTKRAIESNPRVEAWDIDGHSALLSLLMSDDPKLEDWIYSCALRLKVRASPGAS